MEMYIFHVSSATEGMRFMVKRKMYKKVQTMKKQGKLPTHIATELGIDRRTASKYFYMPEAEYLEYEKSKLEREKILDAYQVDILNLYELNQNRRLNMTAVFDYIEEKHGTLNCTEKSFRNYINSMIQNGTLVLKENIRIFDKVPPLPYGQQMQLDFGQYKFQSGMKVYIFAALLSASRYKYVALQDRPFKTIDIIRHLLDCFEYYGGIPYEMVIDQDATLVVAENSGDILYTKEFDAFREEMDMKMYVCRKADPQSKGKIENLVGYVKKSFLEIRDYTDIDKVRDDLFLWLNRRANGKISQATGLVPSELILEERKSLRSLRNSIFKASESMIRDRRIVNKHSFISFQSSLYSVPKQYRNREVEICVNPDILLIYDSSGALIAEHEISVISGQKVIKRDHFRETEKKTTQLKEEVAGMFSMPEWQRFITENIRHFPRYVRDQSILAKKYFVDSVNDDSLLKALIYCLENKSYSFKNLFDTYNSMQADTAVEIRIAPVLTERILPKIDVTKREFSVYEKFLEQEVYHEGV